MIPRAWRTVLARFGQDVTLYPAGGGEGTPVRAFLQPLLRREEDQQIPSPLGLRREDRFLYLGPAHAPLEDGGTVARGTDRFSVVSTHLVGGRQEVYRWALLRPCDGEVGT